MKPQNYGSRSAYRPPADWYQRLNRFGSWVVGAGLAPRGVMTLQVEGRFSGKTRKTPVVVTSNGETDYVVSLAGESQWARNVRAAGGNAVLKRREKRRVRLTEVAVPERAPIIGEYIRQGAERSGARAADEQARFYFGLAPAPSLAEIESIADHYPVFRIDYLD